MSFRKRNVPVADARSPRSVSQLSTTASPSLSQLPGTRSSAVDGRPVTSTGVGTLDALLAGHGGLPLGTHLLIEENGTTDYAGALLRFYASEGLLQGHHVHVVGLPDSWGRDLPGLSTEKKDKTKEAAETDQMRIAWRYEKLSQRDAVSRGGLESCFSTNYQFMILSTSLTVYFSLVSYSDFSLDFKQALISAGRNEVMEEDPHVQSDQTTPFSHSFDLTKRLNHPPNSRLEFLGLDPNPSKNPFATVLLSVAAALTSTSPSTVHRLILPTLLSPALYPPHSNMPNYLLTTFHTLRALLSAYPTRLTILTSLPTSLYTRTSGLIRWLEILADGVLELLPFPHSSDAEFAVARDPNTKEEPPQGLMRIHKLPVLHELGSGFPPTDVDWTFTLSRRKLTIKPFNLPPIEGDTEAQQPGISEVGNSKAKKADLDF